MMNFASIYYSKSNHENVGGNITRVEPTTNESGTKEIEKENSSNQKLEFELSILKTKILALEKVIEKKD